MPIQILDLIVSVIGVSVNILNAMFPHFFQKTGEFLLHLDMYVWIIIVLLLMIAAQQVFIYFKFRRFKS
jgi:hypothetical protein